MRNGPGHAGPRTRRLRRARAAAIVTAMAGPALLAAACGGGPSSAGPPDPGGAAKSRGVAYSQCVRSHGVPNFPDPGGDGQIPKEAAVRALRGVGDSRAEAATNACANLNPAGQGSPALTVAEQRDYLRAAACMRSHGITDFPDPTFPGGRLSLSIPAGIDTTSRRYTQAAQICTKLIPAGLPYSRSRSGG